MKGNWLFWGLFLMLAAGTVVCAHILGSINFMTKILGLMTATALALPFARLIWLYGLPSVNQLESAHRYKIHDVAMGGRAIYLRGVSRSAIWYRCDKAVIEGKLTKRFFLVKNKLGDEIRLTVCPPIENVEAHHFDEMYEGEGSPS